MNEVTEGRKREAEVGTGRGGREEKEKEQMDGYTYSIVLKSSHSQAERYTKKKIIKNLQ